jgi:hypothetical protein
MRYGRMVMSNESAGNDRGFILIYVCVIVWRD